MEEASSDFILLSGIISEDSEHSSLNIPLDDTYTLVCKAYELSRGNKLVEVPLISKDVITRLCGVGALTIKVSGEVSLGTNGGFISVINEISSRKTPFTLNIGSLSFSNILLKSYVAEIDSFGISAACSIVFVQV